MLTLYLISLVLATTDFDTLGNNYTTCPLGGGIDLFNYNLTKLFFMETVDGCYNARATESITEPPGVWKTYPLPAELPENFTISPDPLGTAGLADPTVSNDYTGPGFVTVGYMEQIIDLLYMTYSQHKGAYPNKKVSLAGTLYGVNHIGRKVQSDADGTQKYTLTYFTKEVIPENYTAASTEGIWMLYYAATLQAGLVDTTCVADLYDSFPADDTAVGDYNCTVTASAAKTIDSERFATGYHLVQVNNVSYATVKQLLYKYGPLSCTFHFDMTTFQNTYYNAATRPSYYIPTTVDYCHCVLVYGWAKVDKRADDDDGQSGNTVDVWKIKYVGDHTHTLPAPPNGPYGLLKITKDVPNGINTEDAAAVAYFVKDCTGEPCDTCPAAGCTCLTDCFDCEDVPNSDTTGCKCGTADHVTKCGECPAGANNATCTCDDTVNCAECVTPANSNCTCTALCSTCAEGTYKEDCEPDPPPPDAAFGVKATLLLALVAAFLAL